jgi:sialate O-acetylesterase
MITDWRTRWNQGDFPFLFVQLANYLAPQQNPGESEWAELREAQAMALTLPNTGMAVAIDIGEVADIHPKNKKDVGHRLALAARQVAYGETVGYSGPVYQSMQRKGRTLRLAFTHTGGGLAAKGGPLRGFAIAGWDQKWVWAEAGIEGNAVVVWNDKIKNPVAVRYAWADNPAGANLYNREGLPATPFRTDNWPGITQMKIK